MNTPHTPTPLDPLTAAYQAVISALVAHTTFPTVVAVLNSWADGELERLENNVEDNTLPEATLLNGENTMMPWGTTSQTWEWPHTFSLIIATKSMQVAPLNRAKFAAMGAIERYDFESLQFQGANFIRDVRARPGGDGWKGIYLPTLVAGENQATYRAFNQQGCMIHIDVVIYGARADLPS